MKKIILIAAIVCAMKNTNAQNVNIPDVNFKSYLIGNQDINTNSDNEIQESEAQSFTGFINCSNENISDLSGIEAFTALTQLNCGDNKLTSLDISSNTNLVLLGCHNNQLVKLNLKNGNNMNFTNIKANNNANLLCVEVDNETFSTSSWTGGNFEFDEDVKFSEKCGTAGVVIDKKSQSKIVVYPNPTTGIFYLSQNYNIALTDLNGRLLIKKENVNLVDISNLPTGIYLITLTNHIDQVIQHNKILKIN